MALPGQGEKGGQCVIYAGKTYFGKQFGVNTANEIWGKTGTLTYTKHTTMPSLPCCIVWNNSPSGHVGVVESKTGTGTSTKYRFSDSNRSPANKELVDIKTSISQSDMENLLSDFKGYVKFN